ncbi:MAG: hypothetical protein IPN29_04035 [Saprospiraceae bacterium]|nr:hypothetical protein [Saprospiraceae bacterium]
MKKINPFEIGFLIALICIMMPKYMDRPYDNYVFWAGLVLFFLMYVLMPGEHNGKSTKNNKWIYIGMLFFFISDYFPFPWSVSIAGVGVVILIYIVYTRYMADQEHRD